MSETPVQNHPCDECGQIDDHPMIHLFGTWQKDERATITAPSFHFDCLPAEFEALLGVDAPEHTVTVAAIRAARSGVHGDELRSFIESLPSDNEIQEG